MKTRSATEITEGTEITAAWLKSPGGRQLLEIEYLQLELQPRLTAIAILLATKRYLTIWKDGKLEPAYVVWKEGDGV
jgi:hypothetical protein